jgi:uncharacterized protein
MSQAKVSTQAPEPFSEAELADYLKSHPDFFERHQAVLLGLELPHATAGRTVSLVERQVAMLRQRNTELERQLGDLVAVARFNNALVEKMHRLTTELIARQGLGARLEALEASLREDFAADRAVIVLFAAGGPGGPGDGFVKRFDREDAALAPFSSFLRAAKPRCGPLRERQRAALLGDADGDIASAAMVPLGSGGRHGFIVIGSRDPDHFNPGKRMDFLGRLGELITAVIETEQAISDVRS